MRRIKSHRHWTSMSALQLPSVVVLEKPKMRTPRRLRLADLRELVPLTISDLLGPLTRAPGRSPDDGGGAGPRGRARNRLRPCRGNDRGNV